MPILSFKKSLLVLFFTALFFRLCLLGGGIELNGFDEKAYTLFMDTLNRDGIRGMRYLIQSFPYSGILSQGPLPLRILFVFLGSLSCKLSGFCQVVNLAWISFFSGVGVVISGFLLFRRWFSGGIAFFSALLLVTSPLQAALSSRALPDSFFTLMVISSVLFYHRCWFSKKWYDYFFFGIFIFAGLLTKESMVCLYPLFLAAAMYYKKKLSLAFPRRIIAPLIIAPALYLLITSWIAGGFSLYFKTYAAYLQLQDKIEYARNFQKGPWFRYAFDFFLLSPLACIFSIIGMAASFPDERSRFGRNSANLYLWGGLFVFSLLPLLNLRNVLFLDVFLRALSVFGLLSIAAKIKAPRYRYACIIFLFFLLISADICQYFRLFVKARIYDPVTIELIRGNGL